MIIGDRLRILRETKHLSQGDIEKSTGLLRCYISRVENGHTVPAIETLEKLARALDVPLYQLFYEGENPPQVPDGLLNFARAARPNKAQREDTRFAQKLTRKVSGLGAQDRALLLVMATQMGRRGARRVSKQA